MTTVGPTELTYTVTGLAPGRHTLTVRAVNAIGHSVDSNTQTVTVAAPGGAPPADADVTIDFRSTTYPLDKWSVGSCISTYSGAGGANIIRSGSWANTLAALGPLAWRIPLRYADGNPGSSAGGAQTTGDAVAYINAIRAIGGTPYVVLGGNTSDNGLTDSDVTGFVHYFNDNNGSRGGGKLERLVIGNEPDNSNGAQAYLAALDGRLAAARAADPFILLSAPAGAYWDSALLTQAAGHAVDILSYHAYDGADTDGSGYPMTTQYHTHISDLRAMKNGIRYGVEEFNWHFQGGAAGFLDWRNLLFTASVIGQVVTAGGHANHYSDSNGPLGLLNDGAGQGQPGPAGSPLPAYYGIGMWTGMNGIFRRYGTSMVPATSTIPDVEVYGCDNGKVMLLNKSGTTSHQVTAGFGGELAGVYTAWQTQQSAPTQPPRRVAQQAGYSNSRLMITLPPGTVTSIELD